MTVTLPVLASNQTPVKEITEFDQILSLIPEMSQPELAALVIEILYETFDPQVLQVDFGVEGSSAFNQSIEIIPSLAVEAKGTLMKLLLAEYLGPQSIHLPIQM